MRDADSWMGPEGQAIRWRDRRLRIRYLRLGGEPRQKGSRGENVQRREDFRSGVDQLRELQQGVLTGPVALDLDFHPASRQPPTIHRLSKRYLDVLGAASDGADTDGRRHLLYRDDRQVTLLHVHLWPRSSGAGDSFSGHTDVQARPLRDVVADLELAGDLQDRADWTANDDADPFVVPPVPEIDPEPALDLSEAADPVRMQRRDLNLWLRLHDLAQVQEALLAATDAHIAGLLCRGRGLIACDRPATNPAQVREPLKELLSESRDLLLSHPLHVPLPPLPGAPGDRETFAAGIRDQLRQWQQRWPVLLPLVVPVKVTLLVVTPPQGRDLDNLALEVLPLVHETLVPHPQPWLTRFPALSGAVEDLAERDRLRRLARYSVTAYEVIQLRRTHADPPNGLLRLALGSASTPGSAWARIARYVEDRIEVTLR